MTNRLGSYFQYHRLLQLVLLGVAGVVVVAALRSSDQNNRNIAGHEPEGDPSTPVVVVTNNTDTSEWTSQVVFQDREMIPSRIHVRFRERSITQQTVSLTLPGGSDLDRVVIRISGQHNDGVLISTHLNVQLAMYAGEYEIGSVAEVVSNPLLSRSYYSDPAIQLTHEDWKSGYDLAVSLVDVQDISDTASIRVEFD